MKHATPFRTGIISLLTVALSVACIPGALALAQDVPATDTAAKSTIPSAEATRATYQKSEAVYATLTANGTPEAVYVVNRFDVATPGALVDYGSYAAVQNLTNEVELGREGDATTFAADEGTFYYQGEAASATLPWNVALTYTLNGKEVDAATLAGASGDLAIHVSTTQNSAVDSAFYDSFMMQITFTLPGDACSDVAAEGATVASAGENRTVAFTVLPGHSGDFTLTAKVHDFNMPGAQIAALPYSSVIAMPDTGDMVTGMTDLSEAVSKLNEGTASLATGVDQLTSGAQSLSSGTAAFGQGLSRLNGSSSTLVQASESIQSALASIASGLASTDFSQLDQLKQVPGALNQVADGLDGLAQGASTTQQGYSQALGALDGAIAGIPSPSLDEQQIGSLLALAQTSPNPSDAATAQELVATYQAAQTVKGTYAATQAAFTGANDMLTTSAAALPQQAAALRTIASSMDAAAGQLDQLPQLAEGIAQLSGQYGQFHEGLVQYSSGLLALSNNYCQLESGASSLAGGTSELAGGAGALHSGMGTLNATTITLPETMKKQIAEMTAEYDFPAFKPISFVSSKNDQVAEVQFIMTTAAIDKPEVVQEETPVPELTFWDRLMALFKG